jgi:PAS domain-containing protein
MSSALLKFQHPGEVHKPFDVDILAAAVDVSPEPTAVTENGKLIYANRSFTQLSNQPPEVASPTLASLDSAWQTTGLPSTNAASC